MAVRPQHAHYREALRPGNTLTVRSCVHWVHTPRSWLARERERGATIVGVELAEDATRLAELTAAHTPTVIGSPA